jgi:hypothetical protein
MEFHVTDVDSQTTYVSDLSPSDVWRRVSSALKGEYASDASVSIRDGDESENLQILIHLPSFEAYSHFSPPISNSLVKPPPPGLKMFGLDRKVSFAYAPCIFVYAMQAVREGVATTFKKLVKDVLTKPKGAQGPSASSAAAGPGALKRPPAEGQR